MPPLEIQIQPKQQQLLEMVETGTSPVIGVGGGRGSAKSFAGDLIPVKYLLSKKSWLGCMVMRNWDQIYKYHIEMFGRNFPVFRDKDCIRSSGPASVKYKTNQLDFSYAENLDDIVRRFRSANYDAIIVDQAEQFSEAELREIRKACRSKTGKLAKLILLFNMRGAGLIGLRKWFYTHEVNKDEDPDDYQFLKMDPWDNVIHVLAALSVDGYSVEDYYSWTDAQRKSYAAEKGPYTRQLATDDEAIRKADWEGDWNSIEGCYFSNSFDLGSTQITVSQAEQLKKVTANYFMSGDWGKAHFWPHYWHFRVSLSPREAFDTLRWELTEPINIVVTYREMIVNETTSEDMGRLVIDSTPPFERSKHKNFFLSPECCTDDANSIGQQISKVLRSVGMPYASKADNDRAGGATLMNKLLMATKFHGMDPNPHPDDDPNKPPVQRQYNDAWLISSDCPELLKTIPMLMRDPKDIDKVMKTDLARACMEIDIFDAVRYGLKSMLNPRKKTEDDLLREKMAVASPQELMILTYVAATKKQNQKAKRQVLPPSWRANANR